MTGWLTQPMESYAIGQISTVQNWFKGLQSQNAEVEKFIVQSLSTDRPSNDLDL
jgi:hypothetical protein